MIALILFIIFVALIFDFLNGFHDAANSIATIVSTRVLTPRKAVLWAAFFNFAAAFIFTDHSVAKTIGKGLVDGTHRHRVCHSRGIAWCDCLESHYMVLRYSIKFFPCPDGRIRWSSNCPGRIRFNPLERLDENGYIYCCCAYARYGVGIWDDDDT